MVRHRPLWILGSLAGLCLIVGIGLWRTHGRHVAVVRRPRAVMGTSCLLVAVVPGHGRPAGETALRDAESVLRNLEARLSSWIDASEISRLNAAETGRSVRLSPETRCVLREARRAYDETDGAFDVTCRPLIALWRQAGERGRLPTDDEIVRARDASRWEAIQLTGTGAVKQRATAQVDLGGIAKGYAIDTALDGVQRAGALGGLVDVGGDERMFGSPSDDAAWSIGVKDPFGSAALFTLRIRDAAVCTSGGYARFIEIDGRRYSHIIDPRTGRPAGAVTSVTVLAPSSTRADVWATALSVLGPPGLDRLPPHVDALMVTGGPADYRLIASPGLPARLPGQLPPDVQRWKPTSAIR